MSRLKCQTVALIQAVVQEVYGLFTSVKVQFYTIKILHNMQKYYFKKG